MSRDFAKEVRQEDAAQNAIRQWIGARIAAIHMHVTAHDVLRRNGIDLRYSDKEEQFSCPFHGKDTKPSARVYPETARSHSHVWCFVCQQSWDVLSLWRKFNDFTGKFTALLRDIEQTYGIALPESPFEQLADCEAPEDYALDEVKDLLSICDRRLKSARKAFDMQAFFKLSIALDRIRYQVEERTLATPKAKDVLGTILTKIGERVRQCPAD